MHPVAEILERRDLPTTYAVGGWPFAQVQALVLTLQPGDVVDGQGASWTGATIQDTIPSGSPAAHITFRDFSITPPAGIYPMGGIAS